LPELLPLLLCLAAARPGLAEEGPVVLTNEDVAALHTRSPAVPRRDPLARVAPSTEAPVQRPEPSPGYQGPVDSWQDEYYRLKAEALRRALERGDAIPLAEILEDGPAEPSAEPAPSSAYESGPACVYGTDGKLIYSPRGVAGRPSHRGSRQPGHR